MVYPSGNSIAYGDFYAIAGNGQAVVIKNSSANVTSAKSKGITPIAMVFHTSPSASDQSSSNHDAWTHGYAMALISVKDEVGYKTTDIVWATTNGTIHSNHYGDGNITNLQSEINRVKQNLDGYSETMTILAKTGNTPSLSYPACYYAVTFDVIYPKSSSGWYLPSVGQQYYLYYNANSTTYSLISYYNNTASYNTRIGISLADGNLQRSIMQNKLSVLGTDNYTIDDHHWLSSEVNSSYALIFYHGEHPEGLWYIYPHYSKSANSANVRPFIAF